MLASVSAQIEACNAAVHGNLTEAVEACAIPKESINIFDPDAMSGTCVEAMKAGQRAGKLASHPIPQVRTKLIKDFDQKRDACLHPAPKDEVPERKTTNLWD